MQSQKRQNMRDDMNGQAAAVKWKRFSHSLNVRPLNKDFTSTNPSIFKYLQPFLTSGCEPPFGLRFALSNWTEE